MQPENFIPTLSRNEQDRYIRESLDPATFRGIPPQDAKFRIQVTGAILGLNRYADNPLLFTDDTDEDEKERITQEALKNLALAVSEGQNIQLTTDYNVKTDPYHVLVFLEGELEPTQPEITSVLESRLYPFLRETPGSASFIFNAGPGDKIDQFYPHDPEFYRGVFLKNQRNAVVIFDTATDNMAYQLGTIFTSQGNALRSLKFTDDILKDLQQRFAISAESITIESPNPYIRIFSFAFAEGNRFLLVICKSKYVRSYESFISKATALANQRTLICSIRPYVCKNLFFRHTNFFFQNFDIYLNLFGGGPINFKQGVQRHRINFKRLRNNPEYRNSQVVYNHLNRGENHFIPSNLCSPETRKPAHDPYCVEGKKNEAIFWRGLGGRQKTRRRVSKKRRTRRTR